MTTDFSWSYSRLSDYETCPARYKARYIDKIDEGPRPAADRGTELHQKIEDYLLGKADLPDMFEPFKGYIDEIRAQPTLQIEGKWALDRDWQKAPWEAGWWRGKLDAFWTEGEVAQVVDWKTGRVYDSNRDQMRLYATVARALYPEIEQVNVTLVYLDLREAIGDTFFADDTNAFRNQFTGRAARMEQDTTFAPRRNPFCKWCPLHPSKGGTCSVA